MHLHQALQIRQNTCLIDILQRKYWVQNYLVRYENGQIEDIRLDLKDQFGSTVKECSYKYLYYCYDEFSDADKSFSQLLNNVPNIYDYGSLNLEQLNHYLYFYTQGFYISLTIKNN